jgi:glycine/D-amino acid oxidase-like deaminating enzyme
MRQHAHTAYPVNDVGVTLTDRGDEMKAVIVGGLAAGASTGARLRRLDESAEIVVLERDRYVSNATVSTGMCTSAAGAEATAAHPGPGLAV